MKFINLSLAALLALIAAAAPSQGAPTSDELATRACRWTDAYDCYYDICTGQSGPGADLGALACLAACKTLCG
ncbi:uncharacterized protein BCR38DRAFT_481908 [Pseudomassariella vexata]|uniref:Uncharacterized protein n=1 Tax=Pseudomassariella vexata TaxID=1141098 RepID=A0A1Y2EAX5_9PEZI|nr:uncharacterized protein BCR38DRAFT_481908 [Pseudomassariella vexata]ORY68416.1 hypothetical protein BCR38DRAFT_481908 [Pseudomassariella vexata]